MARLESDPLDLGAPCPDFRLPAAQGGIPVPGGEPTSPRGDGTVALADFADVPVLGVFFYCNHCPYAQALSQRLVRLELDYRDKGFRFVAISSNDASAYPDDSFDNMKKRAGEHGYLFPYLYDESQEVARAFGAVCTPDLYVYDRARRLAYHGRLDDSPMDERKARHHELREAVNALLGGKTPPEHPRPSIGCSIKWK